ncbi:UNVERIFIED_CONTAM: Ankyrin repeat domain-containing protein 10 [Trichonephila clavipes]
MFHNGVQAGSFDEIEFSNKYPVHKCCRDGEIQIVNSILTSQPALIWSEDPFRNWTPIHWAAYSGQDNLLFFQRMKVNEEKYKGIKCKILSTIDG